MGGQLRSRSIMFPAAVLADGTRLAASCARLMNGSWYCGRSSWCEEADLVDISCAEIHTLHMHTFSQCHSLETVKLPSCLREIREVFIGCNALVNFTLPGSIRYIGYRAFGNCAELSHLGYARRNKLEAWRYPYAAFNAFEECVKLATPKWLHYIPPRESDWIAPCN